MPTSALARQPSAELHVDQATTDFIRVRPRLLAVAGRVLGDSHEANDVVQDAWVRWERADHARVRQPSAYLATTTARLALNVATSARTRRSVLRSFEPDDLVESSAGPAGQADARADIDTALRILYERLGPAERAAFILRKAFDYSYARLALALDVRQATARQLVSRAGRRLASASVVRVVDPAALRRGVEAFTVASRYGRLDVLEEVLRPSAR